MSATPGAADLKFLRDSRRIRNRNFKSISGTGKYYFAGARLTPKFA
jgi:hypothetical protein